MAIFYTAPPPLEDAIANLGEETPAGVILRSPDWTAVPAELRQVAFFTAAIENVSYLAEAQQRIIEYVKLTQQRREANNNNEDGAATASLDRITFAAALRRIAGRLGAPINELPSYDSSSIEPLCKRRLRLIADLRVQSAEVYAEWKAGLHDGIDLDDAYDPGTENFDPTEPDNQDPPSAPAFTDDLQASVAGLPPRIIEALKKLFGDHIEIDGDTAKWAPSEAFANARWPKGTPWRSTGTGPGRFKPSGRGGVQRDFLGRKPFANMSESENIERGQKAIDHVLRTKGNVSDAMMRKEVGLIGIGYGRPGDPAATSGDGYGISHIKLKHPGDLAAVPEIISKGVIYPHEKPDKRYIVLGRQVVILGPRIHGTTLEKRGQRLWVVSAFTDTPERVARIEGR